MSNEFHYQPTVAESIASGRQFLTDVNSSCESISLDVAENDNIAHELFLYECAAQQIRMHDPKARSYGVVHQLVATDPKRW